MLRVSMGMCAGWEDFSGESSPSRAGVQREKFGLGDLRSAVSAGSETRAERGVSDRLLARLQILPVAGCSTVQELRAVTKRSGKAAGEADCFSMFCGRFLVLRVALAPSLALWYANCIH